MPRIFGLIPTTDDLPFYQVFGHLGAGVVANNTVGSFPAGSVTMPWDGELFLNYTLVSSWTGYQSVNAHLWNSSPAATISSNCLHIAGRNAIRSQVPVYAWWSGLLKGQVVTFTIACQVGGGGPNVNFELMGGHARAVRVGS